VGEDEANAFETVRRKPKKRGADSKTASTSHQTGGSNGSNGAAAGDSAADGGPVLTTLDDGVLTLPLDSESIGIIIGRAGATVKQIEAETGATLKLDRERSCAIVSGTPAQVDAARDAIAAKLETTAGEESVTIDCGRHLGAVIGKAGAIIQSLQTETGARIDADRSTSSVKLVGSTEQVAAAAEKIRAIVHGEASQLIPLGERGSRVLLADGGAGIKKLSAQFDGVRLELDRDKRALRATGTTAQVSPASRVLLLILPTPV
jgi:rRNA processing protein Krr1/Pno1